MPHSRARHIQAIFRKRLKFFRVVSIQGARQTGKSYFAREILAKEQKNSVYITFDRHDLKDRASRAPDTFVLEHDDAKPVIIDEAQKVPEIFDAVKAHVDVDTTPGQFVLLGSTEFSKEMRIRESLTGRLGRVKIYPFNLAEAMQLSPNPAKHSSLIQDKPRVSRKDFLRHLERGGFPGIFHIHGEAERHALLDDWLRLVLERDLHQFKGVKIDPEFARKVLELVVSIDAPTAADIAKKLKANTKKSQRYLDLLKQLFVVNELHPHPLSSGKSRYFLCDPGLTSYLGSTRERALTTWVLGEFLSQHSYRGSLRLRLEYYRSARGGVIDLVLHDDEDRISAFKIFDTEKIDLRELEILKAFKEKCRKNGKRSVSLFALAPIQTKWTVNGVTILPWESIA